MAEERFKENAFIIDTRRVSLWVAATVLVADSICLVAVGKIEFMIAVGLLLGLSLLSMNLWPYIGMQKPAKDERAAKIGARAGLVSWYISLIVTVIAAVILGYLPASFGINPTLAQGFGFIVVVMVVTMVGVYEYMIRKSSDDTI